MGQGGSCDCSDQEVKFVKVELSMYMHCQGCERDVVYALFKSKGVESVKSSFSTQKVVVTGQINLPELVKTIQRKTGKKVVAELIKDDDDGAAEAPTPIPGCGCHFCRPIHQGYFMPGYMANGMGLNYAVPIQENDHSACSIM